MGDIERGRESEIYGEIVGDDTVGDQGDTAFRQLGFAFSFDASDVAELFAVILHSMATKGNCFLSRGKNDILDPQNEQRGVIVL